MKGPRECVGMRTQGIMNIRLGLFYFRIPLKQKGG